MAITVSDVVSRAQGYSVQNDSSLVQDNAEMISKVNTVQETIFARVAAEARFFAKNATVASTTGSSSRTADLSAITDLERVIRIQLQTGGRLRRVDPEDPQAEIAPRYYVLGQVVTEIGNDWNVTPGSVGLSVDYAYFSAPLNSTGSLTQTLSTPDRFLDVLAMFLAAYLATKDVGRDPNEAIFLKGLADERLRVMTDSLDNFGGAAQRRFVDPDSQPSGATG